MALTDLFELVDAGREFLTRSTDEQERALVPNPKLLLLTHLVLNGAEPFDVCDGYRVTRDEAQRPLMELDGLEIIELRPFNRIKLLTARNLSWRKDGPVRRFFREQIQDEFLDADFDGPAEAFRFVSGSLSPTTRARICRSLERLAREFEEAVRRDQVLPRDQRYGCGAVLAIRPWETSVFAELRR